MSNPSLSALPIELLEKIFRLFDSFHTLKSLLLTSKKFQWILKDLVVVINDGKTEEECLQCLNSVKIDQLSFDMLANMMRKYTHFIFDFKCEGDYTTDLTMKLNIKMLKLAIKVLQENKKYHTIYINSEINKSPLIRFLLPKLNSNFTEFFFPSVETINGFDDLRLLDNTNCVFDKLTKFTIGSFSFQLFNLTASNLKVFNHSDQVIKLALNENINSRRMSYTKFLSQLKYADLTSLDIVGWVEPTTLNRFSHLRVLQIYGDHNTKTFNFRFFKNLKRLLICKCSEFESIANLDGDNIVNDQLEVLDLSNNRRFNQLIKGEFKRLKKLDLSFTGITEYPFLHNSINYRTTITTEGCSLLK